MSASFLEFSQVNKLLKEICVFSFGGRVVVVLDAFLQKVVTKRHDISDTSVVTRLGDHVGVCNPRFLDPFCKWVQAPHNTEDRETIVEGLDQTVDISSLGNKTNWLAKGDLTNNIVGEVSIVN